MIILKFDFNNKIKKLVYDKKNNNVSAIYLIVKKFYNLEEDFFLEVNDESTNSKININEANNLSFYLNSITNENPKFTVINIKIILSSLNQKSVISFKSFENSNFIVSKSKFNNFLNDSIFEIGSKKDSRYRNIIHLKTNCNGCSKVDIRGIRFKCIECKNYSLCEDCEYKNIHDNHILIRIVENFQNYNFNNLNEIDIWNDLNSLKISNKSFQNFDNKNSLKETHDNNNLKYLTKSNDISIIDKLSLNNNDNDNDNSFEESNNFNNLKINTNNKEDILKNIKQNSINYDDIGGLNLELNSIEMSYHTDNININNKKNLNKSDNWLNKIFKRNKNKKIIKKIEKPSINKNRTKESIKKNEFENYKKNNIVNPSKNLSIFEKIGNLFKKKNKNKKIEDGKIKQLFNFKKNKKK